MLPLPMLALSLIHSTSIYGALATLGALGLSSGDCQEYRLQGGEAQRGYHICPVTLVAFKLASATWIPGFSIYIYSVQLQGQERTLRGRKTFLEEEAGEVLEGKTQQWKQSLLRIKAVPSASFKDPGREQADCPGREPSKPIQSKNLGLT